jgi:Fe-S cluster assembly protein SufB
MPRADASVRPTAPADPATIDRARYDQRDAVPFRYKTPQGVSRRVVEEISARKSEPAWVLGQRLKALQYYEARPLPGWGPDLSGLNLATITYYAEPDTTEKKSWEEVPEAIRTTFDRLGIPEAERTYLAGSGAQMESVSAYHNLKEQWEKLGVIFENFDVAVQKHPDLVREYFMTRCVPLNDHKFAALHGAVFSGGTFIYVPPNVKVTMPLQAYFRMNEAGTGQFENRLGP